MNVPLNLIRQLGQAQDDLRDYYESVTFDLLRALWRRRLLTCATVLVTLAAATLLAALARR